MDHDAAPDLAREQGLKAEEGKSTQDSGKRRARPPATAAHPVW